MPIGQVLILLLKNWRYVVAFLELLKEGLSEVQKQLLMKKIERAFRDVKTIEETAQSASDINDSFRN